MRNKKLHLLMGQLFEAHKKYKSVKNNKTRAKIFEACEPLFIGLEDSGVARSFSETFLCYGNEFLKKEFNVEFKC